jgi:N-methylhydantoinase A/oxoprolinase/acetone carboxylase beta subunit/N-methylhydantoinase B/oxoprolinase/acetone carboxylase alpha subunit
MKRIGVDVGGTFTDLILVDEESGRIEVDKVPSTPEDPAEGTVVGVRRVCDAAGVRVGELDAILHGTTVATNIVLQRNGASVGMITTEGFRDILHIARHKRPYNFSLYCDLPWQSHPLVPRRHRLTVGERVTAPTGEVIRELDEDEVRERVRALREAGVDSVAVCLLHSYLNPDHERRIKSVLEQEFPEAYLSVSHEVLPLYREYERFSTVCLNAYIGPRVARYVGRFAKAMEDAGFDSVVQLMQSSGGTVGPEAALARPVALLMSGPVAGLIGGIWAGRMAGHENVITLDMGGTSADIGVAPGGELRMRHLVDTTVAGYQAMVPMIDVDTIGAGGGSIAYVDGGGVFRVGPQSAGADPGPACYSRAGMEPTSTDAQLLLGRLRPEGLLGGQMRLDPGPAEQAMQKVADALGVTTTEAALGVLQIQKFGMTQAMELNSVRRGYDPRDFTLVAAGGAGPLFACDIALELEIPRVLVPPHPGITSATGLLATDVVHEFVATAMQPLRALDRDRLAATYAELEEQAARKLDEDGYTGERALVTRFADCRYAGQGYEVRFEAPPGAIDDEWTTRAADCFHLAHEREYGHRFDAEIDIVNIRVVGVGLVPSLDWPEIEASDGPPTPTFEREAVFEIDGRQESVVTPFYDRTTLRAGQSISGPAIIEQYDSTTVIPPGLSAEIDRHGNIVVDCTRREAANRTGQALATPVLMRAIGGALQSIAKEMGAVLFRISYSSIIRESEDLGAGLFDAEGNELAESDSTPMFMGAMPKIVKGVVRELDGAVHEGDVIAHNHPYKGATHTPDIGIVVPIFWEGELIAFSGASAHLLDIGGAYPGMAIDLVDMWAEGQIWDAVKLYDRGVRNESAWRMLLTNVRTPTHNRGDIEAMIAACELGKRRLLDLVARYGKETVLGAASDWLDYSERMLRKEIAKVPDGTYEAEIGYLDDDGKNRDVLLPVKVKVIVEGDELTIDVTGSSSEVETAFNSPYEGAVVSGATYIVRTIFLDEATYDVFVPQNEGMLRPVRVIAPKGSIFNPTFPRATKARFCQVQRMADFTLQALAPVIPEKITAGNSASTTFLSYSGFQPETDEYWIYLEVNEGSHGGRFGKDGWDSVDSLIANTRNNPIEELEWRFPMRTERYELRDGYAAPGKWRGGVGIVRVNRFLVDTIVACEGDRFFGDPPWGIFGGHPGQTATLRKNPDTPGEESWPSKFTNQRLHAGDAIEITVPNSGGYGDPVERDPKLVLDDVLDGFTSMEQAAGIYRVAIDPNTMTLDLETTEALRKGVPAVVDG